MQQFEAKLIRPEGTGTWTFLTVPFSAEEEYGSKAQVKVKGALNGIPYQGSLMPFGDGRHYMVVNKALRDAAQVTAGDIVAVTMVRDTDKREVIVPDDLRSMLEMNKEAKENFNRLAYSHQKEYVAWIESAKKAETREARIHKSIERILEGKKLKS